MSAHHVPDEGSVAREAFDQFDEEERAIFQDWHDGVSSVADRVCVLSPARLRLMLRALGH